MAMISILFRELPPDPLSGSEKNVFNMFKYVPLNSRLFPFRLFKLENQKDYFLQNSIFYIYFVQIGQVNPFPKNISSQL